MQRSYKVSKIPTLINSYNNVNLIPTSRVGSSFVRSRLVTKNSKLKTSVDNASHQKQNHDQHQNLNSIYLSTTQQCEQQHNSSSKLLSSRNTFHLNKYLRHRSTSLNSHHHHQNHALNLCGYDSFLHATICSVGLNHSVHAQAVVPSSSNLTTAENKFPNQTSVISSMAQNVSTDAAQNRQKNYLKYWQPLTNNHNAVKNLSQIKMANDINKESHLTHNSNSNNNNNSKMNMNTSTISQNLPRHFGYQRLHSSTKHNLAALNLVSPNIKKTQHNQLEKWHKEHIRNYDQILCAKLSKKLQQTKLNDKSIENSGNTRKYRHLINNSVSRKLLKNPRLEMTVDTDRKKIRGNIYSKKSKTINTREDSDIGTGISINGDSLECENLLGQSSEDDDTQQLQQQKPQQKQPDCFNGPDTGQQIAMNNKENENGNNFITKKIPEAKLVDLGDMDNENYLNIDEKRYLGQSTDFENICDKAEGSNRQRDITNDNKNFSTLCTNSNSSIKQHAREFGIVKAVLVEPEVVNKESCGGDSAVAITEQIDNIHVSPEAVVVINDIGEDEDEEEDEEEEGIEINLAGDEVEVDVLSEHLDGENNKEDIQNSNNRDNSTATANLVNTSLSNFNDSPSALVHRYVHEHIHHHYHHFEGTDQ